MGAYDRQGNYHRDPSWMQTEEPDWTELDPEDIEFPDDHDRRYDDMYSDRSEFPDGDTEPF